MNETLKEAGAPIEDAATFAYKTCDSLDTFANVMAKSYVDHALGTEAKDRITRMCDALLNEYRDLVS